MAEAANYKRAQKGDIAYNMMRMWQGAVGVAPQDGLVSPAYVVARPLPGVHAKYFEYLFRTEAYMDQVNRSSRGIVADRNRLYWEDFRQILSPFPPLREQVLIATFLDHADRRTRRYIRVKQQLIALLEERRIAITESAMTSPNRARVRLSAVADRVERLVTREPERSYTPVGLYNRGRGLFHKPSALGRELGDSVFSWLADGDLILSGQFAWEGAVALASKFDEGCIASHRYPILRGREGEASSAFLLSLFRTRWGRLLLDHHSRGAAGRNRPLNVGSLMKEQIPLPPPGIQDRIGVLIHQETRARMAVARLVGGVQQFRARLIADAVTGKIDVREAAVPLSRHPDEETPEGDDPMLEADDNVGSLQEAEYFEA